MDPDERLAEGRLEAAETALRRERRRTVDERRAFETLEDRVRAVEPTGAAVSPEPPLGVAAAGGDDEGLRAVREAYEATVMGVAHYAEEYGDTYAESVEAEFGPGVAAALVDGEGFGPRCKRTLLAAVEDAHARRGVLLAAIDEEAASIEAIAPTLRSISTELDELSADSFERRRFGELDAYRARLDALEANCEELLEQRQAAIFERRRTGWLPSSAPDAATYFYQELPVEYPVMSVVADCLKRVRATRARIERAMTHCRA